METLLATFHALSWSIYLGGAITMELVLRYAQKYMRPSQTAVVCQNSGRRYRWFSLVCLMLLLLTGLMLAKEFNLTTLYGKSLVVLLILWAILMLILALLSFHIHPEMHIRVSSDMTESEVQLERQRVGHAIRQMDIWVRVELVLAILAVLVGSYLHLV